MKTYPVSEADCFVQPQPPYVLVIGGGGGGLQSTHSWIRHCWESSLNIAVLSFNVLFKLFIQIVVLFTTC